jgi:uncharacterized OB-fold protein
MSEADTGPFWTATKRHELLYGWCPDCNTTVFYPRLHCPGCGGGHVEQRTSSGHGTLYTFTVMRQNPHPFFSTICPYAVGYVDLDEGFRILAGLTVADVGTLTCGQRVTLSWEEDEDCNFPLFAPAAV